METIKHTEMRRSGYMIVSDKLGKCVRRGSESGRFNCRYFELKPYVGQGKDFPHLFKSYDEAISFLENIHDVQFYYDINKYDKDDFVIKKIKEVLDISVYIETINTKISE